MMMLSGTGLSLADLARRRGAMGQTMGGGQAQPRQWTPEELAAYQAMYGQLPPGYQQMQQAMMGGGAPGGGGQVNQAA